jgi:phosphohistidine phosphatase SixA
MLRLSFVVKWMALCFLACAVGLRAQGAGPLPAPTTLRVATANGEIVCAIQRPADGDATTWRPLAVLLADGDDRVAAVALADVGFVVATPNLAGLDAAGGAALLAQLRAAHRIDQGGMHAVVPTGSVAAHAFVRRHAHEFQTVTSLGALHTEIGLAESWQAIERLPARRFANASSPAELAERLTALHAARALAGPAADVARALDDFHDAAAVGDETRYFARLPDDAVFLGTDATERWTGAEFRAFALPYFQRPSAWTYVALQRRVQVADGGAFAWFDEALDNASYGECRGSGVLQRRDGRWVVRQYNLTILVPNDLAAGHARRVRALQAGLPAAATTVVLVRHAEKVDQSTDAALSEAGHARAKELARVLGDLPIAAVYTSQFVRTKDTVAPLCAAVGVAPVAVDAKAMAGIAATIRERTDGGVVVVCGHSNTLPQLAAALGLRDPIAYAEGEYDALHVVALAVDGEARGLALRYGR